MELHGRGPLDHAGAFGATLNPLIDDMFKQARTDGRREERDALAYDALQEMARLARAAYYGDDPYDGEEEDSAGDGLQADSSDTEPSPGEEAAPGDDQQPPLPGREDSDALGHGGPSDGLDGGPSSGAGRRRRKAPRRNARRKRVNPSHLAILRLDVEALRRGYTEGGELCEIAGVGPIPVDAARGLLGDAILKLVLTKGTAVANVVHLGRGPTVAQRTALLWAQPECSVAGCSHTFTQIDHRHDWHLCHQTTLHNLDTLCPHHHRKKTHEGWALVPGTGKRAMVPPDDPRHPSPSATSTESRSDIRTPNPPSTARVGNPEAPPPGSPATTPGRSWTAASAT